MFLNCIAFSQNETKKEYCWYSDGNFTPQVFSTSETKSPLQNSLNCYKLSKHTVNIPFRLCFKTRKASYLV